jgi:hypothetical protein
MPRLLRTSTFLIGTVALTPSIKIIINYLDMGRVGGVQPAGLYDYWKK